MTYGLGADARLIPSATSDFELDQREQRADQGGAYLDELTQARVNAKAAMLLALREYERAVNVVASEIGAHSAKITETEEGQLDDLLGDVEADVRNAVERFIEEG